METKPEKPKTESNEKITKIGKYKVIGRIKISKINLDDVILQETTDDILDLGLYKLWGPDINEPGNVSIIGHNFRISRSPLFTRLKELNVGDTFELIDLDNKSVKYKIYDTYYVKPTDTECLDQNEDGKREVTLITCKPRWKRKRNF